MNTTGLVTTVTDELLAELDSSVRVVWRDDDATVIAVDALTAELRRLRAENAELAKDAGRYRWMRDGAGYCDTRDIPGMAPLRMDEYIDTAMERPQ